LAQFVGFYSLSGYIYYHRVTDLRIKAIHGCIETQDVDQGSVDSPLASLFHHFHSSRQLGAALDRFAQAGKTHARAQDMFYFVFHFLFSLQVKSERSAKELPSSLLAGSTFQVPLLVTPSELFGIQCF
jgi:hypothetical protein